MIIRKLSKVTIMNNTELVTELDKLVATSRFSHTRKTCLSEFIGKKYKVSGLVSRVGNTSGYSRRPELRKGKTITLGLSGSNTKLLIRCNRSRSLAILEHDLSQQFSITITITGYDDVRQYLQADELGEMNAPRAAESNTSLTMIGDNVQHAEKALGANSLEASSSTNDQADQLLAELEQMQLDSQNILSEVADDINRAQSRNLPLLRSDYKDQTVTTPVVPGIGEAAAPSLDTETEGESAHPGVIQIRNEPEGISQSKKDLPQHPESDEIIQNSTVIDTTTGLRQRESKPIQNASTKPNAEMYFWHNSSLRTAEHSPNPFSVDRVCMVPINPASKFGCADGTSPTCVACDGGPCRDCNAASLEQSKSTSGGETLHADTNISNAP